MVYIIANLFWDLTGYWGTGLSWYIDTLGLRNGLTSWGSNSSMAVVSWASLPNTVSSGTDISSSSNYSWGGSDNSGWSSNYSTDNSASDSMANQSGLGMDGSLSAYRLDSGSTFLFNGSRTYFFSNSIESCVANLFLLSGALLFGMSFAFGISYGLHSLVGT